MGQHHDSAPSLNYTVISIDSLHMRKDGSNDLKFLLSLRAPSPIPLPSPNAIQNAWPEKRGGEKMPPKVRTLYTTLWTQWGEWNRPKTWYVPLKRWSHRLPQLGIPFAHSRHDLNNRRKPLTNDVNIKTNISRRWRDWLVGPVGPQK